MPASTTEASPVSVSVKIVTRIVSASVIAHENGSVNSAIVTEIGSESAKRIARRIVTVIVNVSASGNGIETGNVAGMIVIVARLGTLAAITTEINDVGEGIGGNCFLLSATFRSYTNSHSFHFIANPMSVIIIDATLVDTIERMIVRIGEAVETTTRITVEADAQNHANHATDDVTHQTSEYHHRERAIHVPAPGPGQDLAPSLRRLAPVSNKHHRQTLPTPALVCFPLRADSRKARRRSPYRCCPHRPSHSRCWERLLALSRRQAYLP